MANKNDDHKAMILTMLMGKNKLKKAEPEVDEHDESEDEGDLHSEGLREAMSDFLKATRSGNVDSMVDAFKQALDCHDGSSDEQEEDTEEDDYK